MAASPILRPATFTPGGLHGGHKANLAVSHRVNKPLNFTSMSKSPRKLEEWEELQRKIFTRFVNQKLASRHFVRIEDVLTDLGKGDNISNLITALSGAEMKSPKKKKPAMVRAQQLEEVGKQMQFCWDSGVNMSTKIRPSAENILDGDFIGVMGLVYNIMLKFLRFEDDDGEASGSAKDSLLRWCKFNTVGFNGVDITNLTKSWHNGLALSALVCKFNPDAMSFDSLDAKSGPQNLQAAMNAAEKFFDVEKFLEPSDIPKLDDKSMLVFLSEYYYGINEWFKIKLAANRFTKLVTFTRENDEARDEYNADGAKMLERLTAAEALVDGTDVIHNTMAGAKKNLADFNNYKVTEKRQIVALQMKMSGAFTQLNLRLSNNKRPAFAPDADIQPPAIAARVTTLHEKESVEPKLYLELNRQIKLAEIDAQHTTRSAKTTAWIARKDAYLAESLEVASSAAATKLLKQHEAFVTELGIIRSENFVELQKIGAYLAAEKYEHIAAVDERETGISTGFDGLSAKGDANKPILDDNLARETFKEATVMKVDVHKDLDVTLLAWCTEKHGYLDIEESVTSVVQAKTHASTLDAYDKEKADVFAGNFVALQEIGGEIRGAEYKTEISQWVYPDPDTLTAMETKVSGEMAELDEKSAHKRAVLVDALAREELKDQVNLWVTNHKNVFAGFDTFAQEKLVYLAVKEVIKDSLEAKAQLNILEAFELDKHAIEKGAIAELKSLGEKIRSTEYSTQYSQWKYGQSEEVTAVETNADELLAQLAAASAAKKAILEDDLARELYAEETRLIAGQHLDKGLQCANWATLKVSYMESEIVVHSIHEAQVSISLLASYSAEKVRFTNTAVATLKELGKTVLSRKYETQFSNYTFENPDDIRSREEDIDDYWQKLDQLCATRQKTLDELLVRELRKEQLRIEFADFAGDLVRYADDKIEMIGTADEQKTLFGFNLKEVEAYDSTLTELDTTTATAVASKREKCSKAVAEMALLVKQTEEFDREQAMVDAEVDKEDAAATSPTKEDTAGADDPEGAKSPTQMRKKRFGTLSKSIKKAFGRSKKKRAAQELFKQAAGGDASNDTPWPEASNPYTSVTVADIGTKFAALGDATGARRSNYAAELARWRENDALCKNFAELVNPMQVTVGKLVGDLLAGQGTDEEQLELVKKGLEALIAECFKIPDAKAQDAEIKNRNISINPYTSLSAEDMQCELENVQAIAEHKKPYLVSLIQYKKYQGISPEQYAEMETLFKEFDKDNSGNIDAKELRACLFSLGEERSTKEVGEYVKKYGDGKTSLSFVQFRSLMVILIGDAGTQDGLIESFKLLSKGLDHVTEARLEELCKKPDVAYFAKEAPAMEDGREFAPWVAAVFAR